MTATAAPRDAGGGGEDRRRESRAGDPRAYAGEEMTLVEHLEELRARLFKSAVAIVLGFVAGYAVHKQVLDILITPYCQLPPELRAANKTIDPSSCSLIFTDVLGAFFISLKAAAVVAIIIAAPVVFYQVWRFVTPGLRPIERRYALPFIVISQLLFAGGAVFSYFIIPRALEFLLGFAGESVVSLMDASRYLSFVLRTMIAFGVSFELPLILIMLSLMGVVSSAALRRYRRNAIFAVFVAAAIITPTQDPLTMTLMAGPLVFFYEVSVLVARFVERRRSPVRTPEMST